MTLISMETGSKAASWRGNFGAELGRFLAVYPLTWGFWNGMWLGCGFQGYPKTWLMGWWLGFGRGGMHT